MAVSVSIVVCRREGLANGIWIVICELCNILWSVIYCIATDHKMLHNSNITSMFTSFSCTLLAAVSPFTPNVMRVSFLKWVGQLLCLSETHEYC